MNQQPQSKVRKKKKIWLWVLILLVIAAAAFFLVGDETARQNMKEEVATVRDISTYYNFSGNLTPVLDETQTAKETMKIKQWYVAEGDKVEQGDLLFRSTEGLRVDALYAGTVEEIFPVADDTVQSGSNLVRIVDYDTLEVSIDVDEYDIKAISIGKEGEVYINALGKTVIGKVSDIARNATDDGGVSFYPVTMQVDGLGQVRSGMSVEVEVLSEQVLDAVSLNLRAISYDEYNKPYVSIENGEGDLERKPIKTGVSDGVHIQVVEGLNENDVVMYSEKTMQFFPGSDNFPMPPAGMKQRQAGRQGK